MGCGTLDRCPNTAKIHLQIQHLLPMEGFLWSWNNTGCAIGQCQSRVSHASLHPVFYLYPVASFIPQRGYLLKNGWDLALWNQKRKPVNTWQLGYSISDLSERKIIHTCSCMAVALVPKPGTIWDVLIGIGQCKALNIPCEVSQIDYAPCLSLRTEYSGEGETGSTHRSLY